MRKSVSDTPFPSLAACRRFFPHGTQFGTFISSAVIPVRSRGGSVGVVGGDLESRPAHAMGELDNGDDGDAGFDITLA